MNSIIEYILNKHLSKNINEYKNKKYSYFTIMDGESLESLIFIYETSKLSNPLIKFLTNNKNIILDIQPHIEEKFIYISELTRSFSLNQDIVLFEKIAFEKNINLVNNKDFSYNELNFLSWFLKYNSQYFNEFKIKETNNPSLYNSFLINDIERINNLFNSYNINDIISEIKNNPKHYLLYILKQNSIKNKTLLHFLIKAFAISEKIINENPIEEAFWFLHNEIEREDLKNILIQISNINDTTIDSIRFNLYFMIKFDKEFNDIFKLNDNYTMFFKKLSKEKIIKETLKYNLISYNYILLGEYLTNQKIKKDYFLNFVSKNKEIHTYFNKVKNQEDIYEWSKPFVSNKIKVGYILNSDIIIQDNSITVEDFYNCLSGFIVPDFNGQTYLLCDKIDILNFTIENKFKIIKQMIKVYTEKENALNYLKEKNSYKDNLENF